MINLFAIIGIFILLLGLHCMQIYNRSEKFVSLSDEEKNVIENSYDGNKADLYKSILKAKYNPLPSPPPQKKKI